LFQIFNLQVGQKPCQIISPHLNVGGPIKANASNGNTQVFMNGREITKVELRMLQVEFQYMLFFLFVLNDLMSRVLVLRHFVDIAAGRSSMRWQPTFLGE